MKVFGEYNRVWYNICGISRDEPQEVYKIVESFRSLGFWWLLLSPAVNFYYYFIIPPYLALYWDEYHTARHLGKWGIILHQYDTCTIQHTSMAKLTRILCRAKHPLNKDSGRRIYRKTNDPNCGQQGWRCCVRREDEGGLCRSVCLPPYCTIMSSSWKYCVSYHQDDLRGNEKAASIHFETSRKD